MSIITILLFLAIAASVCLVVHVLKPDVVNAMPFPRREELKQRAEARWFVASFEEGVSP